MTIRLYSYSLPTHLPFLPLRKGLLLEWDGRWGEIAPLPGWSKESLEEAQEEILHILPNLNHTIPLVTQELAFGPHQSAQNRSEERGAVFGARLPSVRFAIQCATLPFPPPPIRCPLTSFQTARPRFRTLKLKLGHLSVEQAIETVQTYTHRLRLDFNGQWSLQRALQFASHFTPQTFDYLEEPVSTLPDLFRFSEITQFPIAIDESFRTHPTLSLSIPTLKSVVIKPTITGSIPLLPPHLSLILSSSYETSIGLLQIARQAPATHPHGLDTFSLFPDHLLSPPLQAIDGMLIWEGSSYSINRSNLCLIATHPSHSTPSP